MDGDDNPNRLFTFGWWWHHCQIPSALFLCVHNAGRSQIAAGFARALSDGAVEVFSAGSDPTDQVHTGVAAAMSEVGIDISHRRPQRWTTDQITAADVVVTMGCGDECPVLPGVVYLDWDLTDPEGLSIEEIRPIRDEIKVRVSELFAEVFS